jgi:hypothetical protein
MQHHTPHWHRGIHALHFGLLGGLVAVAFLGSFFIAVVSPLWVTQADAAVTRFASGSFWDTTVPGYVSLHPDSAPLVNNIVTQASSYGTSVSRDTGSSTVYEVDSGTPMVTVVPYDCGNGIISGLASQWSAVPLPFYAVPAGGSTTQIVIYQPSSGSIWEFGHMRNISGQWQACTGGFISSSTSGVFSSPYGVTSSGLAALGGQLSTQEITSGQINHVIGLNLPQTNGISWPATQYSGSAGGTPATGQRIRLDPSINIEGLGLSPVAKAIARAGQTYGFVVWNRGSTVGFTAESTASSTSRGLPDPYSGLINGTTLNGFPWEKLQVLPNDYGQSTGIPTITKFSASQTTISSDTKVTLSWQANNVTRCAIGGIADNLAASGSMQTDPLQQNATFTLRCGGPLGVTTSQVEVKVTSSTTNQTKPGLSPGTLIDQPYAGYANIFSDLMAGESATGVYKVVYYDQKTYVSETATPPFALYTLRLQNGPHTIRAKIYYQDGHSTERVLGVSVQNTPEVLQVASQSNPPASTTLPLLWGVLGGMSAAAAMGAGTWWGWRRAHLI